jgi:hypothetical protein
MLALPPRLLLLPLFELDELPDPLVLPEFEARFPLLRRP